MTNQETTTEETTYYHGYFLVRHDDKTWHATTGDGSYIPRFANYPSREELVRYIDESLNIDQND
jgi:hypothetical protein